MAKFICNRCDEPCKLDVGILDEDNFSFPEACAFNGERVEWQEDTE